MTFDVAFAYLSFEKTNNFKWALRKVKVLFMKNNVLSHVIASDRNLAFMNTLETMFLSSTNLLCMFHINKNVNTKGIRVKSDNIYGCLETIVAVSG